MIIVCIVAETVRVSLMASDVQADMNSIPASRRARYEDHEQDVKQQINTELLEATLDEVRHLREVTRSGVGPKSLGQRKVLLRSIKLLTRFRREIVGVDEGSVIVCVRCPTIGSLVDLRDLCLCGTLAEQLCSEFLTCRLLTRYRLRTANICVTINMDDYRLCLHELLKSTPLPGVLMMCCF